MWLLDVATNKLGAPLLVLEPVMPGPTGVVTVADWQAANMITEPLARRWLSHLATALHHCSTLIDGFVHGDLKLDNLLVDVGWVVRLFDFGSSGDRTTSATVGAALYRAPEVWDGATPTQLSDSYAFGCVAYELLTGRPPFRSNVLDPDALREGHCGSPVPADDRVPPIILACLDKRADNRPLFPELAEVLIEATTRRTLRGSHSPGRDRNDAAAAYIALGDPEKALPLLDGLLRDGETNPAVIVNLATSASQSGYSDLANAAFQRALVLLGEEPTVLVNFATDRFRAKDFQAAQDLAQRALAVEQNNVAALVTLSATLNEMGKHEAALSQAEKAVEVDGAHAAALYQVVYTALMLRRCSKASLPGSESLSIVLGGMISRIAR